MTAVGVAQAVDQFLKLTGRNAAQRLTLRVDLQRVGGRTRQRPGTNDPRRQPMWVCDLEHHTRVVFERQARIFGENQEGDWSTTMRTGADPRGDLARNIVRYLPWRQ